jgi:CheY-like chemotaxis protein
VVPRHAFGPLESGPRDARRREGAYAAAPRADLILLDLDLPRLGGHGVLAAARRELALHDIPVTMLSNSSARDDVERAHALGAVAHIEKALDLDPHLERLRFVERPWTSGAGGHRQQP